MLNPESLDADNLNILYLAGEINPFDPNTDPRDLEDLQTYPHGPDRRGAGR